MPSTPAAPNGRFSVTVTKPGHAAVRIGPFTDRWSARGFAHALDHVVRGTGAPAGTTADVTGYDPDLPHRCVPAAETAALARQIGQESEQAGPAGFPDLFTRLVAHRGWENAARAWLAARAHRALAAAETAPDRGGQPQAQQTFTVFGIINREGATPSLDVAGIAAGDVPRADHCDRPWAYSDTQGRFSATVQAATWQDAEEKAHEGVESGALREPWR
ncbi:hypothetical protein ACGRHY_29320 [Streptomyces sp. HK10]|uniref:hypothetical protein n=1 Tax=Streptomyces sp. HK10 TaxID=3373255 RepID=UPI00374A7FCF